MTKEMEKELKDWEARVRGCVLPVERESFLLGMLRSAYDGANGSADKIQSMTETDVYMAQNFVIQEMRGVKQDAHNAKQEAHNAKVDAALDTIVAAVSAATLPHAAVPQGKLAAVSYYVAQHQRIVIALIFAVALIIAFGGGGVILAIIDRVAALRN